MGGGGGGGGQLCLGKNVRHGGTIFPRGGHFFQGDSHASDTGSLTVQLRIVAAVTTESALESDSIIRIVSPGKGTSPCSSSFKGSLLSPSALA